MTFPQSSRRFSTVPRYARCDQRGAASPCDARGAMTWRKCAPQSRACISARSWGHRAASARFQHLRTVSKTTHRAAMAEGTEAYVGSVSGEGAMILLRGRLGVAPSGLGLACEGGSLARVDRAVVSRRSARAVFSRNLVAAVASMSAKVDGGRRTSRPDISADPKSRAARPEGADPREATEAAALWACEARRRCTRAVKGVIRSLAAAKRAVERSSASSRDRRGGLGRHDAFSPSFSARLGADFFAPPTNPPPACAARRDARIASMGLDRRGGPTPSPPKPIAARTGAREAGNNQTRLRANRAPVPTGRRRENPRNSREPNSRAPRSRSRTESAPAR